VRIKTPTFCTPPQRCNEAKEACLTIILVAQQQQANVVVVVVVVDDENARYKQSGEEWKWQDH